MRNLCSKFSHSWIKHSSLIGFSRKFKTFGAFTSGIGIHYAESTIVDVKHQTHAKSLIIGQRMLPQILVRAADARPYELQDLLPADTRFKVLIFTGDTTDAAQRANVEKLAEEMGRPDSFLKQYTPGQEKNEVFDILAISSAKKEHVNYTEIPQLFRSHWSKYVLVFLALDIVLISNSLFPKGFHRRRRYDRYKGGQGLRIFRYRALWRCGHCSS